MEFLRIRNFEKFQHYKDRRPPWIKLYRDLWNDPRFFELSEADRYFLISFFVIASQNDNRIPNKESWLKREMATRRAIPVAALVESGWLEWCEYDASTQDASAVLATSVHDDSIVLPLARSRETETETETDTPVVPKGDEPVEGNSPKETYPPDFEQFWKAYPRKEGKGAALKAWKKLKPAGTALEVFVCAIEKAKRTPQWKRDGGQYIPHPATWLNERRWDDEPGLPLDGGPSGPRLVL